MSYINEDQRPPFVLSDVQDAAELLYLASHLLHALNVPVFSLKNVADFSAHGCRDVPDMRLERVDQKKL